MTSSSVPLNPPPNAMLTSILQVILQQTKHFTCECRRCMDPTELGMNLAAMRCPKCKSGDALPLNPRDLKTNFECQECHEVVEADMVILFQIFQYLNDYQLAFR